MGGVLTPLTDSRYATAEDRLPCVEYEDQSDVLKTKLMVEDPPL